MKKKKELDNLEKDVLRAKNWATVVTESTKWITRTQRMRKNKKRNWKMRYSATTATGILYHAERACGTATRNAGSGHTTRRANA